MEDAYLKDVAEVAASFNVQLETGLDDTSVAKARNRYGPNELPSEEATPIWKLLLGQFDDTLVKILLVAAVVDFIIALTDGETFLSSLVEPSVIILILIANATVGVVTERNAENAIEQLKAYEADSATVVRGGRVVLIPASQLVPGDVVEVAVGGKVPADVRVAHIYTSVLRIDQSILTGESDSVLKSAAAVTQANAVIQDKTCMLFSGTLVTSGRARGIVVATGQQTAIGQIRDALSQQEDVQTPLKQKLDEFGTLLSKVIAFICALVWVINIRRFWDPNLGGALHGALYYFKIAVALAVAAIPEGLPAVVTTCLALGTRKMAMQRAIVRKLPSVETLGCTTVICTDKTGTLTTNMMSVVKAVALQAASSGLAEYDITGNSLSPEGEVMNASGSRVAMPAQVPGLLSMAMCGALCNDSTLSYSAITGSYQRIGESTEVALRVFAEKVGIPPNGFALSSAIEAGPVANQLWQERWQRISTLEFSRDRKMMSVLCTGGGMLTMFTKGAPEAVLQRCTTMQASSGEGAVTLTAEIRAQLAAAMQRWGSEQALRCLALACKPLPVAQKELTLEDEEGLTLVGLLGLHDPPRRECRAAVEACRAAGIRVIAVTGDNRATAEAVCRQVGIIDPLTHWSPNSDMVVSCTGQEFAEMDPRQKLRAVESLLVLSRVEPLHKLRLVELLQAKGHIVAMTGDGVNDAPALRKADIGVAMGSGTAVARHAADMVLADDNFASIVSAVAEGRAIYGNMKQFIRYMISSNIGEVVAIFVAALLGIPEVLSPVQLLWVNLVTDGLPATALGFNKPDGDVMRHQPRRVDEPIVNGWLFLRYLVVGLYVGLVTVLGFTWWYIFLPEGPGISWRDLSNFQACEALEHSVKNFDCKVFASKHPRTIAMTVLVVVEMFNALNNLSENASLLRVYPWSNRWLLAAITTSMSLHFVILYFAPAAAMFGVTPLTMAEWWLVLWLSAPVILVDEIMKYISRRFMPSGWLLFSQQQQGPPRRKGVPSLDSFNIMEIVSGNGVKSRYY